MFCDFNVCIVYMLMIILNLLKIMCVLLKGIGLVVFFILVMNIGMVLLWIDLEGYKI